jgi:hypothetical protein
MARRVSTAAIIKENIEGRSVEEISIRLKIPVSDVVKAVSDPKFKRDLLDYRLMCGLQQFETIGNLKGYLHAYVKALKDVIEHDPEFFKDRIKNPKIEIHKELKGMMDVIRIASEITDRDLKKMMREAEEAEDPSLAKARARLKEKKKQVNQLIELKGQVIEEEEATEAHHGEGSVSNPLGSEREDYRAEDDRSAGAAEPRPPDSESGAREVVDTGQPEEGDGNEREVQSYLLED